MLNLAEIKDQVKSKFILNVKSNDPRVMTIAYRALKNLGWSSTMTLHATDRTPVFTLGNASLHRDPSRQYDWILEAADGNAYGIDGDLVSITAEAEADDDPTPQHPADAIAAEIAANEPHLASRAAKAAELIKSGQKSKNEYNLRYYTQTDRWECDCPDSQHRNLRSHWGAACKHGLTGYIAQRIAQDKDRVGFQRLDSDLDRERARSATCRRCNDTGQHADINQDTGHVGPIRCECQPTTRPIPQLSSEATRLASQRLDAIHARNAAGDAALAEVMKPEGHRPRYEVKGHYYG